MHTCNARKRCGALLSLGADLTTIAWRTQVGSLARDLLRYDGLIELAFDEARFNVLIARHAFEPFQIRIR
jgi:hypothetical protein